MNKNEIKEKYNGFFGVFTHDMYKATDEDYSNGFLMAFESFVKAHEFAEKYGENAAMHII